MKTTLSFLTLLFLSNFTTAQTTITLPCSRDASIGYHTNYGTDNNNYGNAAQISGMMIPGNSGGFNNGQGVFDFDLSSIPSGSTILSASLNLYALVDGTGVLSNGHVGSGNSCFIERITEPWNENTVTWNNRPNYTSINAVSLPASTSPFQDYLNIDVKNLVEDMIVSIDSSNGFLLRLQNEVVYNLLSFSSKDNGNPNKIPTLTISYESPLSIRSVNFQSTIDIMPNPTTDKLIINITVR